MTVEKVLAEPPHLLVKVLHSTSKKVDGQIQRNKKAINLLEYGKREYLRCTEGIFVNEGGLQVINIDENRMELIPEETSDPFAELHSIFRLLTQVDGKPVDFKSLKV